MVRPGYKCTRYRQALLSQPVVHVDSIHTRRIEGLYIRKI